MNVNRSIAVVVVLTGVLVWGGGCAADPNNPDPHEKVNRVFYKVNEGLDKVVLKPMGDVYVKVIPRPVRTGLGNAFDNLAYGNVILNDLLQGRFERGLGGVGRVAVNSTVGVAGIFDVAEKWGMAEHKNDFGITLGKWGFKQGDYLVLPVFGPSSTRDVGSIPVGMVTHPFYWIKMNWEIRVPLNVLGVADKRSRADFAIRFRDEAAIDPYVFTREAYLKLRRVEVEGEEQVRPGEDFYEEMGRRMKGRHSRLLGRRRGRGRRRGSERAGASPRKFGVRNSKGSGMSDCPRPDESMTKLEAPMLGKGVFSQLFNANAAGNGIVVIAGGVWG
jgi:phospholipid-binding lipoprotein MlaA